MHTSANLQISASTLFAFVFVLARMSGVFVFIPLPGREAGPTLPRIALALGATIALYARWPAVTLNTLTLPLAIFLMLSEMALGAAVGLLVAFLTEAFTVGAQSLAMQAGYAYASVVDPSTNADSDVLMVIAQLLAGLLFFTADLHLWVMRVFARSLELYPPGQFLLTRNVATDIVQAGAGIFAIGLRLSLPIVVLLLLTEITLSLVGRISTQLHVAAHTAPVKMLLTLVALSSILIVMPHLYRAYADQILRLVERVLLH
ncbi:MAG TPA: flagellar biosynthetic protein FliR [Bryobacteraceae bacterium]|jgi:flagellar biosynthetic protein FliR|nr:flagellar biosynthetic protein FliR [Bryobacteraceae bacterium]